MNAATFCQLCKNINQKIPGLLPEYENWDEHPSFFSDGNFRRLTLDEAAEQALGRYYVWKDRIDLSWGSDELELLGEIELIFDFAEANMRQRLKRVKDKP